MKPLHQLSRTAGLALALAVFSPVIFADEPAAAAAKAGDKAADETAEKIDDYRAQSTELNKVEVRAALAQIDAQLDHLNTLADAAPTPEQKADIKARYSALKDRRNELKKQFTRARYDAFKADLQAEMDKVAAWSKQTFSTKPGATSAASATSVTANETAEKIADYRSDSSEVNKAEVKASLAKLDADIDLLAAKIDAVTDTVRKDELKVRLQELKDRRSALNSEFRKARYDALVADVKTEWNKLTD